MVNKGHIVKVVLNTGEEIKVDGVVGAFKTSDSGFHITINGEHEPLRDLTNVWRDKQFS